MKFSRHALKLIDVRCGEVLFGLSAQTQGLHTIVTFSW
jgi:hypothetical protein